MARAVGAALLLMSTAVSADVFSPGELSRGHKQLEGLKNCTQCHSAGEKLSQDKCLGCHLEVRDTVAAGRGLHGLLKPGARVCESCHHEHQGRDFALIDWGAEGGAKSFDHTRAGYPLKGGHAKVACADCHVAKFVKDDRVRKLIETKPSHQSYLGLPTNCASCHTDVHKGQLGSRCENCHNESAFKPAPGFDHAKAAFKLLGAHGKVKCADCHKEKEKVVQYKPLRFASCENCHKDPHQGRLGPDCKSCHVESSWQEQKLASSGSKRAFHNATRFPLRGGHQKTPCKGCHGPFPDGRKAQFKNMSFATCDACHADAHAGQLKGDCASCHTERSFAGSTFGKARHTIWPLEGKHGDARCNSCHVPDARLHSRSKMLFKMEAATCASCHADPHAGQAKGDCNACHAVQAFAPARYEVEDHKSWPLEGAHAAAACTLCHKQDKALASALRAKKAPHAGPWVKLASLTVLQPVALPAACEACHQDPHQGSFAKEKGGCASCHVVDSWHGVKFDHAQRTGFPLEGKHASASCADCHGSATSYKGAKPECTSCHAEPHVGKLGADCARCHNAAAWAPDKKFTHDSFPLDGRHAEVKCAACHPQVEVANGTKAVLYKPLPVTCEGCHSDFHRGAFERWTK